jgi:hypothetical protein
MNRIARRTIMCLMLIAARERSAPQWFYAAQSITASIKI